ncbi:MAG: hypothetical protein GX355_02490 [Globicatella sulfidifaciens]|uniref:Uncharacterized protein n=2 Tax=Globicatella sulfidifaciens TaxID=136093 RepID=A0A7X8GZE1_9LACT|nr:hypothetical protein [Globicatella sulfidifaciens]
MKKFFALAASTLLFTGPVATTTMAQTTIDENVLTEIQEANKHFESVKWDGFIKVSAVSDNQTADMGQLNFNGTFNGIPLQGSFEGNVSSLFLGGQEIGLKAFYQNSTAYIGTMEGEAGSGINWTAYDFTTLEADMIKSFQDAYSQSSNVDPQKTTEFTSKYMDVTETDTDYVYTLKQDINAEEMWNDVDALVDLEKVKEDTIANMEEQSGEALDEESRAQLDKSFTSESLAKFLQMKPVIEVSYNKETKFISKLLMDLTVNMQDFMGEEELAENAESGMPQSFSVHVEMNFSEHNVPQEVTVPEEALAVEVQQPSSPEEAADELEDLGEDLESVEESAMDENAESGTEESAADETAADETTADETVEETTAAE